MEEGKWEDEPEFLLSREKSHIDHALVLVVDCVLEGSLLDTQRLIPCQATMAEMDMDSLPFSANAVAIVAAAKALASERCALVLCAVGSAPMEV
jgi:hypothetical protein